MKGYDFVYLGVHKLIKNDITACDYNFILSEIKKKIENKKNLLISPIASYALVLASFDKNLGIILNKFDYLLPDSQWVRNFLNALYGISLKNRISGTNLMLKICNLAQRRKYKIFLYGTTEKTLKNLKEKLVDIFPNLNIVGVIPSKFREVSKYEKQNLIKKVDGSEANILFIALGSPLQEIFSYNLLYKNPHLKKPIVVIPVGAAFDFISGVKPQAPRWMQEVGLEWLFRFICEPRRLWKRYLIYGPIFIILILAQKISLINEVLNPKKS